MLAGELLDFPPLADPPPWAVHLPQPRPECLPGEHAGGLGADIRRGHEVAGAGEDDAPVTADVRGPDGPGRVSARYLVGCDGAHSVRHWARIRFPGTTCPVAARPGKPRRPERQRPRNPR